MRFQDAARDGRAVVYAGIQADPLVARAAERLATADSATRVMARAVMNGTSTDRAGWVAMFPTLLGDGVSDKRRPKNRRWSPAGRAAGQGPPGHLHKPMTMWQIRRWTAPPAPSLPHSARLYTAPRER